MSSPARPWQVLGLWILMGLASGVSFLEGIPGVLRLGVLVLVWTGGGAVLWFWRPKVPAVENPPAETEALPELPEEPAPGVLQAPEEPEAPEEVRTPAEVAALVAELEGRIGVISEGLGRQKGHKEALKTFSGDVDFIRENVFRAFEISDNLANTAKQAFELSEKVQSGVRVVTESLDSSLKNTETLFQQSKQISRILEIMADVSEKIHILSINASIVSARAGTSGKGFEIVAKEIRNLAKETENSLKEIENVITELQGTISEVIGKVKTASGEALSEKDALISVAGSLQGVILAVEIIRAVTGVAKEKTEDQAKAFSSLESAMTGEESELLEGLKAWVAQWRETYKL